MYIDYIGKTVYLSNSDVGISLLCPVCSKPYLPNGTGPAKYPKVSKLIQRFPADHTLGGPAAYFHDLAYLLCPEGWVIVMNYFGVVVAAANRETADNGYEEIMRLQVNKKWKCLVIRKILKYRARLNADAARLLGRSSYRHQH